MPPRNTSGSHDLNEYTDSLNEDMYSLNDYPRGLHEDIHALNADRLSINQDPLYLNEYSVDKNVTVMPNITSIERNRGISTETTGEAIFLLIIAGGGVLFNTTVILCLCLCRNLRRASSAFVLHGCVLDAFKSVYCVPFALSLLYSVAPGWCNALGGSYVIIVTASGFNIVAMICSEAYNFRERGVGGITQGGGASLACVVFGILMVYIGSIIIHLGPTIIGGEFSYNDLVGSCVFIYGTVKSYVSQLMWIIIMSLALGGATYYLVYFYRHIQAHHTHRLASLVHASLSLTSGAQANRKSTCTTLARPVAVRRLVREAMQRARLLIAITLLFTMAWYPLFIFTLSDPHYHRPTKLYKLLTFLAYSNGAVTPLMHLLFDRNISLCHRCPLSACAREADRRQVESSGPKPQSRRIPPNSAAARPRQPSRPAASSCRLCHDGLVHDTCNGGYRVFGRDTLV